MIENTWFLGTMTRYIGGWVFFVLLFQASVGHATPAGETPWYQIELLIFLQRDRASEKAEHWPEDVQIPDLSGAVSLDATPGASGFGRLAAAEFQLQEEFARLRGSSRYKPLLHLAWRQPVANAKRAVKVGIQHPARESLVSTTRRSDGSNERTGRWEPLAHDARGQSGQALLEGTAEVSIARYLHLDLDLLYRRGPSRFRMREKRRMRSNQLHYLDNPVLGVLVLITPYEPPTAEPPPEKVEATHQEPAAAPVTPAPKSADTP